MKIARWQVLYIRVIQLSGVTAVQLVTYKKMQKHSVILRIFTNFNIIFESGNLMQKHYMLSVFCPAWLKNYKEMFLPQYPTCHSKTKTWHFNWSLGHLKTL